MKRAKEAEVTTEEVLNTISSVVCPHCHTTLRGIGGGYVKVMECWHCKNPIKLVRR